MINSGGKAAILLGLVFAAGLTGGLALERYALHGAGEAEQTASHSDGSTTIERFADELGVTNEQRARIDPILVDTRERMAQIYERYRPEWQVVVDSARARIEAVLTPEQVEEYRALLDKQEQERRSGRETGEDAEQR